MFRLTLRSPSPIPLELPGLTPTAVANLSAIEVARWPVFHGNRRAPLGEFFDVTAAPSLPGANLHFAGDTINVHGIGSGMADGFIYVENDIGRHAGARMTGGLLIVNDRAGDWLGAEMKGGSIEVRDHAGNQVGAAYRGSRKGMSGGTILVRGNAGDEVGLLMRRGSIVVEGRCGEFAGASMIAGSLFLCGGPGGRLGAGMKRGTIVVPSLGVELPPSFRFACRYKPTFLAVFVRQLQEKGFPIPNAWESTEVDCYRGDILHGGRGEILVPCPVRH